MFLRDKNKFEMVCNDILFCLQTLGHCPCSEPFRFVFATSQYSSTKLTAMRTNLNKYLIIGMQICLHQLCN